MTSCLLHSFALVLGIVVLFMGAILFWGASLGVPRGSSASYLLTDPTTRPITIVSVVVAIAGILLVAWGIR